MLARTAHPTHPFIDFDSFVWRQQLNNDVKSPN